MSGEELLTVAQAARRYHVHPKTIYLWLARNEITRYARQLGQVRTFVDAREIERKLRPAPENGQEEKQ